MGISRDSWHKRYRTGATRPVPHKKRKYELGRQPANTKVKFFIHSLHIQVVLPCIFVLYIDGAKRIRVLRVRGGNTKIRALRLDSGNYSWASEKTTRKTRIIDTVYNSTNNELVRTKTLVKGTVITIDAAPFRQWYEAHYALPLARKKYQKLSEEDNAIINKKRSASCQAKYTERQKTAAVDPLLLEQFATGRLLARISSSPGQVGRADGYILEGKELEFYLRKIRAKKAK
ncbi:40S ribosomal protein S8 [Trichostrongylus colubriformis]|uniref:40S ribosomal protein S8 n=1 Tax=Trichostrongylus colubriformis TaxID=6319 RepID=A0AAN8GAK0_TRICO